MADRRDDAQTPSQDGRADRGFAGRRRRRRRERRTKEDEVKAWTPITKLGRLVKEGKISCIEEIYLHSIPIKEPEIVDFFLGSALEDEVMSVSPVQKQTRAGQRTRFKSFVAVGDKNGHVGLGSKCSKEVAHSIKGALNVAKASVIPVRRGYWGVNIGAPHTVPVKVNAKCGSVRVKLVPAPKGTGIVAAPTPKKLISLAGVEDVYSQSRGSTATLGNFAKATYHALRKTYLFLTPDLWPEFKFLNTPFEEHALFLSEVEHTLKDKTEE
eukprot:TRINITY_DN12776_c0_g1_i1.p1 TRINITY_DN12776_c0_g1~~TRINITY_DN12776_c0_g1_i1.p1  ORF type:complete len:269 (+),score=62.32 TRINITY_DN12776_c0_g1_i1:53-859(+)